MTLDNLVLPISKSEILEKMKQIEKDIPFKSGYQIAGWEARWIKLKCWLEMHGEDV